MSETKPRESIRARERRWDTHADHRVLGYVYHEHSMNGQACNHPWAVQEFEQTGISFYCGECRVGIAANFGATGELLMDLWQEKEDDDD